MSRKDFHLHDGRKGAAIAVRVIPRAKKNEIAAVMADGTLKIKLTSPPVEGQANQALIRFLAELLSVPRQDIEIVAGQTRRNKLVSILNMDKEIVQKIILAELG